jgi:hypothetical protein
MQASGKEQARKDHQEPEMLGTHRQVATALN